MEDNAPEIARLGVARLAATRVAMREHAAPEWIPRISHRAAPRDGRLLLGATTWSKAEDQLRDPRYALHGVVSGPDPSESELKLHGLPLTPTRSSRRRR